MMKHEILKEVEKIFNDKMQKGEKVNYYEILAGVVIRKQIVKQLVDEINKGISCQA